MRTFLRPSHTGAASRTAMSTPARTATPMAPPAPDAERFVVAAPVADTVAQPVVEPVVAERVVVPTPVVETDRVATRDVVVAEGPNRVPSAFLAAAAGAALVIIGLVVLARAGIDGSWQEPIVRIAGMDHTPLLGAIDIGVGVVLLVSAMAGATARFALGIVLAIAGAVLWIEPDALREELAAPWWFGAIAVGVGALIALLAFLEGNRTYVERHTLADRSADVW